MVFLFPKENLNVTNLVSCVMCHGCACDKATAAPVRRLPLGVHTTSTSVPTSSLRPGELVLLDLIFSPYKAIQSQATVALVITDAATRYNWIYFMRHKDEAHEKFTEWLAWMKENGREVSAYTTIRTDNGGEFTSSQFVDAAREAGVKRERCPPYQ
jgi:hypothetical protein